MTHKQKRLQLAKLLIHYSESCASSVSWRKLCNHEMYIRKLVGTNSSIQMESDFIEMWSTVRGSRAVLTNERVHRAHQGWGVGNIQKSVACSEACSSIFWNRKFNESTFRMFPKNIQIYFTNIRPNFQMLSCLRLKLLSNREALSLFALP